MYTLKNYKYALPVISLFLAISYQNCGGVSFQSKNQNGGTNSPDGTGTTICNPLGGQSGSGSASQGLYAQGYYYALNGYQPDSLSQMFSSSGSIQFINTLSVFGQIDVPDEYYTQGLASSQGVFYTDSNGNPLLQYFGFTLQSNLVPGSEWSPGYYQFASLSDDGSIFTASGAAADGSDFVVNNDGTRSFTMGCSSQTFLVTSGLHVPMTYQYFQGPPTQIGLMLMYRSVPSVNFAADPLCGSGGNEDFFLNYNNGQSVYPPQPLAPYQQLTGPMNAVAQNSGGWKVVEPDHFALPPTITNSCN